MTVKNLIDSLSQEQVNDWWEKLFNKEITKEENKTSWKYSTNRGKKTNWKYHLEKQNKKIEFKSGLRSLAKLYNYELGNFDSNSQNRDSFCDAFNFSIYEELVYDKREQSKLKKHIESKVSEKELFQDFISFGHKIITELNINQYKVRMAIESKDDISIVVGMRSCYSYFEKKKGVEIGFLVSKSFSELNRERLNITYVYDYKGQPNQDFLKILVRNWGEIPNDLLLEFKEQFKLQYDFIKNSKRVQWNVEANTTNSAIKYLMFKNENVETWLKRGLIITHKMEFFTHREFELLNKYQKVSSDKRNKELEGVYRELKNAYNKLEYWLNSLQADIFPNGGKHILKKPTNQANNFDGYLWAKLYPTKKDKDEKWLAFTIGLDSDFHFTVKIDTVGLTNKSEQLNKFLNYRGNFYNSIIVKRHKHKNIKNWDDLLKQSALDIKDLISFYNQIKSLDSDEKRQNEIVKINLNQILYGPPGTGKTYRTKKLAVEIIENIEYSDSEEDRLIILDKYETYVKTENVCFTTFHQSMSYEDFVEGIKPILNEDEEKELGYEIQNGIFKTISFKANKVNNTLKNEIGAIAQVETFDVAWDFLVEEITEKLANTETPSFPTLTNKTINVEGITDKGNLLLKPSFGSEIEYTVSYNRIKKLFEAFDDLSKVKNIDKEFRAVIGGANSTAYWSILNQLYNWIKENQDKIETEKRIEESKETHKNHILIIDEINRGNVSAIFGELITLLEEDKRIGQKEVISITLPYSKTKFSVPENLYIIGTMNTADRSVEALDTALRRRFSFTEVAPTIKVLPENEVDGINLRKLLQTINDRIEILIDKDHKIGHSYFMKIETLEDLKQTFKNKVIPLLEEYFFGDYGKIGLVLGNKFIKIKEKETKIFFAKNFTKKYEDSEILREKAVYLFTDEESWNVESFTSIYEI